MATARLPQPTANDPVKVDPKHYTVEFENDRVRVIRMKYKPGEEIGHAQPSRISCSVSNGGSRRVYLPGREE